MFHKVSRGLLTAQEGDEGSPGTRNRISGQRESLAPLEKNTQNDSLSTTATATLLLLLILLPMRMDLVIMRHITEKRKVLMGKTSPGAIAKCFDIDEGLFFNTWATHVAERHIKSIL